MKAILVVSATL